MRHARGNWIWLRARCELVRQPDEPHAHLIGIAVDITEQKRLAEESATAEPCSVKATGAPGVTTGASLSAVMLTVLVAGALSKAPSLAVQVIVRLVLLPKSSGLSLVEEKVIERSAAW